MSQFAGHVLSGSILIAFGLKWSLDATTDYPPSSNIYEVSTHRSTTSSTSSSSSSSRRSRRKSSCEWKHWPFEAIMKLIISIVGGALTLLQSSSLSHDQFKFVSDLQYATVYLLFSISGLVDLLVFHCPLVMPVGLEKFVLALAFGLEGLILRMSGQHSSFILEQNVNFLLTLAIYSTVLILLLESFWNSTRLVRFSRAYFTLIHGSWFIQSGFILYHPSTSSVLMSYSGDEYSSALTWISLTFLWHCAGALVMMLILMALSRKRRPPVPPPPPPALEHNPFVEEHNEVKSIISIPRCQFSSLSREFRDSNSLNMSKVV